MNEPGGRLVRFFCSRKMRLSKITILVLICIIVLSVFVAKISNLITIKYEFESPSETENPSKKNPIPVDPDPNQLLLGDSPDHLMWFIQVHNNHVFLCTRQLIYGIINNVFYIISLLQISDIHVSVFHDPNRITDFRDFCNITIEAIKPTVVIASGNNLLALISYT